jgi:hypothetical protein
MAMCGKVLSIGDRIELPGGVAEVLEIEGQRAKKIRVVTVENAPDGAPETIFS